ncbi:LytR/AlgR family response regulator transcription factor [Mesoterricola silvestris]|uniref:DNA-binding response regulator n=1 Tax=Mesoterricola silvestris TaxID=2927979 RepID=A0AA48K957_9BACT|nr:response regulator transcription factor [Mesoterricola silvestris]BDU72785.1 DNA-binding response regulator [Mesoterricola silvestris]
MDRLNVVIADDEPLALERLARLLNEADCQVVASLEDGPSLLEWVAANGDTKVDVLFLDIQMPGLNGLEVLAELKRPPLTVFVTAHADYAIQAFEAAAVDYLLKPVYEDRLARTLQRVRERKVHRLTTAEWHAMLPPLERVPVLAGFGTILLDLKFITHFEFADDKVWAHALTRRHETTWGSLREVEETFPAAGMVRIQRNLLLRPEAVIGVRELMRGRLEVRLAKHTELIVSRTMAKVLRARLSMD